MIQFVVVMQYSDHRLILLTLGLKIIGLYPRTSRLSIVSDCLRLRFEALRIIEFSKSCSF